MKRDIRRRWHYVMIDTRLLSVGPTLGIFFAPARCWCALIILHTTSSFQAEVGPSKETAQA